MKYYNGTAIPGGYFDCSSTPEYYYNCAGADGTFNCTYDSADVKNEATTVSVTDCEVVSGSKYTCTKATDMMDLITVVAPDVRFSDIMGSLGNILLKSDMTTITLSDIDLGNS